jgi:hypothetical protein
MLEVAGALIQTVFGPPPAVDSEAVIPPEAAMTQSIPLEIPVLPRVLPVLLTPKPLMALWLV